MKQFDLKRLIAKVERPWVSFAALRADLVQRDGAVFAGGGGQYTCTISGIAGSSEMGEEAALADWARAARRATLVENPRYLVIPAEDEDLSRASLRTFGTWAGLTEGTPYQVFSLRDPVRIVPGDVPEPDAPTNLTAPSISGTPTVGQALTATEGTWTGGPIVTLQWLRNGAAISGATGLTYLLIAADAGANISVRATATNAGGSVSATSTAVGPVTEGGGIVTPDWSDVDAIVFIGASHELGMYGTSSFVGGTPATLSEDATAYLGSLGTDLPVYCWATGGVTSAAFSSAYNQARARFPNALIFSGFGGNDVSDVINAGQTYDTMTTEQRALIQGRLDNIANSAAGSDDHLIPYFISFRNYKGLALAHPDMGSDAFNMGIFKDWMLSKWPWSIAADGRALLDMHNFTRGLAGYLVSGDGYVHPTGTFHGSANGYQLWREYQLRQVHSLLTSGTTDRPAAYVRALGEPDDYVVSFGTGNSNAEGNNVVNFSTSGSFPVSGLALVNTRGEADGATVDIVLPETAVAGGTSVNSYNANVSGVTDASFEAGNRWYDGTPWNFSRSATNAYICANVTVTLTFHGLVPGAQYRITASGIRIASTTTGIVKVASGDAEAQYESILAAEAGVQNPADRSARITGIADASGNLVVVLTNAGGQYARFNGVGIKRAS
ncbi:hypothetical protein D2T31_00670 [Sinirhodobacter populi]|uniref:SGNH/GDSL hydrolase family protein n=1 Tax=Paenirhodobacter populi TaxID=2306993 RepID=A0A443KIC8_9RHOB|nr:hypothetical protein [Sinirhodobacter populi]RWR32531.1 hypothetical protein D2T31_00670 [Sinirhodobacter populi]